MNQNPMPNTTPVPPMPGGSMNMQKKGGGNMSSIIAIVVIIILLALGGIYYAMTGGGVQPSDAMPTTEDAQSSTDPDVQAAVQQGTSNDLTSIEADVNATDLGAVDTAINGLGQ